MLACIGHPVVVETETTTSRRSHNGTSDTLSPRRKLQNHNFDVARLFLLDRVNDCNSRNTLKLVTLTINMCLYDPYHRVYNCVFSVVQFLPTVHVFHNATLLSTATQ
jgi:hypothetical protein